MDEGAGPDGAAVVRLRILATADLHGHLLPRDDYADQPRPGTGLVQAAGLIARLRADAPGGPGSVLLLDDGDTFHGSLLSDWAAADAPPGPHPMAAAMDAMGYDAVALGNHEFDHGLPALRRILSALDAPALCANLADASGEPLARPSVILDRTLADDAGTAHALRIGILGVAPQQTADWDAAVLGGALIARDPLLAAAEETARLRAAGADLVVALAHTGIDGEEPAPGLENAAVPLAAIPGLDVVVAGHSHRVFPGPGWTATAAVDPARGALHGKPAVQPGAQGSHVGVVDLTLARGPGGWRVAAFDARACPVSPDQAPDPALAALAAPWADALARACARPAGRTRAALHSHFALVGPDRILDLVADAMRDEARRLLRGTPHARLPVLAAVSPFKCGGRAGPGHYIDIPPGPLDRRQAAELYVHPNTLCVVEITGAGLRDWLERSAAAFRTLAPGMTDQPLLDPAMPCYAFDVIDGLAWTLDPTRPPRTDAHGHLLDPGASRVSGLRHDGRPVAPDDRFALATHGFRLGSGGGFAAAREARPLAGGTTGVRDILLRHLSRAGEVGGPPRDRWRFAPHPGTAAWFDTGPGALAHLRDLGDRRVDVVGPTPEGFQRLRLWL